MREPVRDYGRLLHIINAINRVEEYRDGFTYKTFRKDTLRIHAIAYNIQIIGEATYKLTKDFKINHPDTPWKLIEKMRHILVHDYFAVDIDLVWMVISEDLPVLKQQIQHYIEDFKQ